MKIQKLSTYIEKALNPINQRFQGCYFEDCTITAQSCVFIDCEFYNCRGFGFDDCEFIESRNECSSNIPCDEGTTIASIPYYEFYL